MERPFPVWIFNGGAAFSAEAAREQGAILRTQLSLLSKVGSLSTRALGERRKLLRAAHVEVPCPGTNTPEVHVSAHTGQAVLPATGPAAPDSTRAPHSGLRRNAVRRGGRKQ